MKTVVLLYDTSCIYEIVILNYFLKVTGKEMQFVSLDGKEITTTEGYRILPEDRLGSADPKDVELLVIPGGDIEKIDIPEVWKYLKAVFDHLEKMKDNMVIPTGGGMSLSAGSSGTSFSADAAGIGAQVAPAPVIDISL